VVQKTKNMSEMSFAEYWEAIKKNAQETGYPEPDEDIATMEHMAGVLWRIS
jgi:hypothetical protein